jgi:hypothetical protein
VYPDQNIARYNIYRDTPGEFLLVGRVPRYYRHKILSKTMIWLATIAQTVCICLHVCCASDLGSTQPKQCSGQHITTLLKQDWRKTPLQRDRPPLKMGTQYSGTM